MSQLPVVDIYKRTCRKEGVVFPSPEEEVEVFEAESVEEIVEEEEIPEEPLDLNALQHEMNCMSRRIQQLQLKLKMLQMAECPEEQCVDFEVELTCSQNKEICALQKNQHKLQCQMNEVIRCCRLAKDQIGDLRLRMCEKTHQITELQKAISSLNSWRDTLQHEFGLCIERFEYLKSVKCEAQFVDDFLYANEKVRLKREQDFLTKQIYNETQNKKAEMLASMNDKIMEILDLHVARFVHLEELIAQQNIEMKSAERKHLQLFSKLQKISKAGLENAPPIEPPNTPTTVLLQFKPALPAETIQSEHALDGKQLNMENNNGIEAANEEEPKKCNP